MYFVVIILAIVVAAAVSMLVITKRGGSNRGSLSRETLARDSAAAVATPGTDIEAVETAAGRARGDDSRQQAGELVPRDAGTVATWTPLDPEELSVSRRMFFNRAILMVGGLAVLPPFGLSLLAFLWPSGVGGFGSKVTVKLSDAQATWATKIPFYVPAARTYLQPYPSESVVAGAKSYSQNGDSWVGMQSGVVALYQKCVHLGCRVPWCASAQWFECPCHGSKYNRVGEKRDGPAPRGLDRWPVLIAGDNVTIDTSGLPIIGPPIGTDTTKQAAEGPHCV